MHECGRGRGRPRDCGVAYAVALGHEHPDEHVCAFVNKWLRKVGLGLMRDGADAVVVGHNLMHLRGFDHDVAPVYTSGHVAVSNHTHSRDLAQIGDDVRVHTQGHGRGVAYAML